jgi:hypothetical protein
MTTSPSQPFEFPFTAVLTGQTVWLTPAELRDWERDGIPVRRQSFRGRPAAPRRRI